MKSCFGRHQHKHEKVTAEFRLDSAKDKKVIMVIKNLTVDECVAILEFIKERRSKNKRSVKSNE